MVPDSQTKSYLKNQIIFISLTICSISCFLFVLGSRTSKPLLELTGFMITASTWIPLPADTYILSIANKVDPVQVAILAGGINALAVLVEAKWLRLIFKFPRSQKFQRYISQSKLSLKAQKYMFLTLLFCGAGPFPFEPARVLAALTNYSRIKYFIATFLSRSTRFFVIIKVGVSALELGIYKYVIYASILLFIVTLYKSYGNFKKA